MSFYFINTGSVSGSLKLLILDRETLSVVSLIDLLVLLIQLQLLLIATTTTTITCAGITFISKIIFFSRIFIDTTRINPIIYWLYCFKSTINQNQFFIKLENYLVPSWSAPCGNYGWKNLTNVLYFLKNSIIFFLYSFTFSL